MAVTVVDAAIALRIIGDAEDTVPGAVTAILTRQLSVASALVESWAPTAPEDVKDEGALRLVAFLYDQDPSLPRASEPMLASGAAAVLGPWHIQRLLGADAMAAAGMQPDAPVTGAQVVALLEALQGTERLPASAVRDLPHAGSGVTPQQQAHINKASQVDRIDLVGDNLTFQSADGTNQTIDLDEAIRAGVAPWALHGQAQPSGGGSGLPSFAVGDAGEVLTVATDGQSVRWEPLPSSDTSELEPLAALPAIAGYDVGAIINVSGTLYELVSSTAETNVYNGIIADLAGNFIGTDIFSWEDTPTNVRAALSKAVLGSSPPATLYIEVHTEAGLYAETELARAAGSDTQANYAYHHAAGEPGLLVDTSRITPIGGKFSVSFYTDAQKTTPFAIYATNRWEQDARQITAHRATRAEVYAQMKAILTNYFSRDTTAVRLRTRDSDETINLLVRAMEPYAVTNLGGNYYPGEQVNLTENRSAAVSRSVAARRFIWLQGGGAFANTWSISLSEVSDPKTIPANPFMILAVLDSYTGSNATALAGKVFVITPAAQITNKPEKVVLTADGDWGLGTAELSVNQAAVTGLATYFEVTGVKASDLDFTREYYVNLLGGTAPTYTKAYPAGVYRHGWIQEEAWILSPSAAASWARQGQNAPSGGGGGGFTKDQIDALADARVEALVANWAEVAHGTTLVPSAKLAAGGATGNVLTKTATGQAWQAAASGGSGLTFTNRGSVNLWASRQFVYTTSSGNNLLNDNTDLTGISGIPTDALVTVVINLNASGDNVFTFPTNAARTSSGSNSEVTCVVWAGRNMYQIAFGVRNGKLRFIRDSDVNNSLPSHPNRQPFVVRVWST